MSVNIDELQIEVSATSDKAEKSLDRLIKVMDRLQVSTEKCTGLTKIKNQLSKLHEVANQLNSLNSCNSKVENIVSSINKLNGINTPNLTKVRNQTAKLKEISKSINEMSDTSGKINSFVSSIKPLSELPKVNINSYIKSLEKLPELSKQLKSADLNEFTNGINRLTQAIKPLATEMQKLGNGYSVLPANIKNVVNSNQQLTTSNERVSKSSKTLGNCLSNIKVRTLAIVYGTKKLVGILGDCLNESNAYVENLNLFTVAMGNGAKAALDYAETVNDALGIDTSEWIRNQGIFKQITTGFGVIEDKSLLMSKNLTQLGYDISSFFNISIDESMQKLESGISGELEPLRRLGYALDAATLQQIAYDNGIKQNINTMTQAQKSQLRYLAIMQQSKNAMGDMSRTVITPANSLRILEQQFTQLKRAIGNVVSVVAVKLIPYIQAAVKLLTEFAGDLAKKWGFELPKIDYSDTTKATKDVAKGMENVSDNADDATDSVKKTVKEMQRLAGFDELNILQRDKETDNENSTKKSTKKKNNTADLGLDLPEYDFLNGSNKKADEIYKKMKDKLKELKKKFQDLATWIEKNKGLVKGLAGLLAGLWALNKVKKFMNALGGLSIFQPAKKWLKDFIDGFKSEKGVTFFQKLKNGVKGFRNGLTPAQKLLGTIVGTVMASYGSYNLFNNLAKGTLDWKKALGDSALIIGGLATAWLFGGAPGLAVAGLATAFAGLYGYIKGCDKEHKKLEDEFMNSALYGNGKTKISDLSGGFDTLKTKLKESLKPSQDLIDKIDETDKKINGDQSYIDKFVQKLESNQQPTATEIGKMQGHFNDLIKNMKNNMGTRTELIYQGFHDSTQEAAKQLGIDVGEMEEILDGFKEKYCSKLDNLKNEQDALTKKLANGTITDSELQKYQNNFKKISDMNYSMDENVLKFKNNINELTNIDFEDEETAKKSIENIQNNFKDMIDDIEKTREDSLINIVAYRSMVEDLYNDGDIDKPAYDNACKLFDAIEKNTKKAYDDQKQEIINQFGTTISALKQELNNYINKEVDKNGPNASDKRNSFTDKLNNIINPLSYGLKDDQSAEDYAKQRLESYYKEVFGFNDEEIKKYTSESYIKNGDLFLKYVDDLGVNVALECAGKGKDAEKAFEDAFFENVTKPKLIESYSNTFKEALGDIGTESGREFAKKFVQEQNNMFGSLKISSGQMLVNNMGSNGYTGAFANIPTVTNKSNDKKIEAANIDYYLDKNNKKVYYKAKGFATGGYPTKAQLFYAREDGRPEMVGKIGNQTAVANNEQITEGIANAVYKGYCAAMNSRIATGGETKVTHISKVYLKEREIGQAVDEYQERQSVRSGVRR